MKTLRSSRFERLTSSAVLAFGLTAGLFAQAPVAPAKPTVPPGGEPPTTTAPAASPEYSSWDDIKSLTHENKAEFAIGLTRLQTKLDKQIAELKDKRAKMKNENPEWDFAMRNLEEGRSYLKSVVTETETATASTWDRQKEKVARAWQSTQEALDRVKATTTQ